MASTLIVQPKTLTFGSKEFDAFHAILSKNDESTVRWPIQAASDLMLDENARLDGGYALSTLSYAQICDYVASGLWRLTTDVCGDARRKGTFDQVVSLPLAIHIFNKCVELRFRMPDGICGRHMVQNHLTRTVDGVVGPRYRYLAHHQLLVAVVDMLASAGTQMRFHSGLLTGRRMSMTFLADEPMAVLDTGETLVGGCYFSNSEAGECGVRGALMLQLQGTTLRCVMNMRHLSHAGKSFTKKLGHLLSSVLGYWDVLGEAANNANQVLSENLELSNGREINRNRKRVLIAKLCRYCDKSVARDVMRRVALMGAYGKLNSRASFDKAASRTVRDIVIVLMKVADGQYPEVREQLEIAAYAALSNQMQISKGK